MAELLKVSGVCSGYGDVRVLHDVDLAVNTGEIVCLIGSNGAGKTTLLRTLSGVVRQSAGSITFLDRDISGSAPQQIVKLGVVHVPEGRRLFAGMTVRENLLMGAYLRTDGRAIINRDLDFVLTIFPKLAERLNQDASTMSGGEQQMCAVGRGIMANPMLLMIDELSLGLSPKLVGELSKALVEINKSGLAILLVEQDVATALKLAHRGFVIDTGRMVLSGLTHELAKNGTVREAYLGAAAV
ncbi:MAG: ABC transporter ATP-binding protein [Bradyrhizobiaceae bacterium]|nr:MAG: ABC transporter ATP-binding protein [Bradyrhizobiaceae bacterium]